MINIPHIKGQRPRVLLITQDYFIVPELARGLRSLGISFVSVEFQQTPSFLKELFDKVAFLKPHFILSVNHAGLDGDGQVLGLLKRCGVPFASWFVDRQETFLRSAVESNSLLAVFSWDPEAISSLNKRNVPYAQYLPLGTDTSIFHPVRGDHEYLYPVSFVGSSWTSKIVEVLRAGGFSAALLRKYKILGGLLEEDFSININELLDLAGDDASETYMSLPSGKQEMFFRLIQLQATRLRRIKVVSGLLEFNPAIVGDVYWARALSKKRMDFTWWNHLKYEDELPAFYRQSMLNFNTVSLQSAASLNQRIFDVPACGSFLLTEYNSALENLFEPGREVACYDEPDNIPEVISKWLSDEKGRKKIIRAGMKRIFAEHTYQHRIVEIISKMNLVFYK
ncbi:CgeB family protein [Desulfovibrio gilichinskyi]|uniref:Spore maturation protein CgeB n=1 Tax=Desulfovibrio gilichinskyi TaxID=1519643 RepID=A0A1X7CST9_9BACT|nr:glycosyltransferase [Desulfovibrio gilichinskyi]SMF02473.1 spore maturation protein CgeB [Desulfovibrio gilichinskyi]